MPNSVFWWLPQSLDDYSILMTAIPPLDGNQATSKKRHTLRRRETRDSG